MKEDEIKSLKTYQVYRRFESVYNAMLSYCLNGTKNTESKNPKVARTKNGRIMFFILAGHLFFVLEVLTSQYKI